MKTQEEIREIDKEYQRKKYSQSQVVKLLIDFAFQPRIGMYSTEEDITFTTDWIRNNIVEDCPGGRLSRPVNPLMEGPRYLLIPIKDKQ